MSKIQGIKATLRATAAAVLSLLVVFSAAAQTVRYIHTDGLGSVVLTTDKDRNIVERSEYEPYGSLLNRSLTDGPGYTGHVMDTATGLTYMQQRYYDQAIGKMLSVDPVTAYSSGNWRQFNAYAYANNNPYKFTDPDGRTFRDAVNGFADGMSSNFLATPSLIQKEPIDLTPQPYGGIAGNATNLDYGIGRNVANALTLAIDTVAGGLAGSGRAAAREGLVAGEEASSSLPRMRVQDITRRGAAERNYQVNWSQKKFEGHLRDNGYTSQVSKDGKVANWFDKDGNKAFTTRSFSTSTKGPSADMYVKGEVVGKIRFEKEK